MVWEQVAARARVITDNDYAGDPDGLVQLAHLLLSPSVDVPLIVASHLGVDDPMNPDGRSAARAAIEAHEVAARCARTEVPIVAGSETGLVRRDVPADTPAARAIVAEAMRADADLPLFVTCGGGLTEIASAWLLEPRIAERLTLVWIGGAERDGVPAPPGTTAVEYNAAIDLLAVDVVFEDSTMPIWQVPRDVYRTAIVSRAELLARVATAGDLGWHLFERIGRLVDRAGQAGLHLGETFILGDNPLVLLTALWSSFHPDPASSRSVLRARPGDGPPVRSFTAIDTRLMVEDLAAKLALHARR